MSGMTRISMSADVDNVQCVCVGIVLPSSFLFFGLLWVLCSCLGGFSQQISPQTCFFFQYMLDLSLGDVGYPP